MKNIHILPTDKPSKLFIDIDDNKLKITEPLGGEYMMNQHIYITSDEEIKGFDWCYDKVLNIVFQTDNHTDFNYVNQTDNVFKIILTTDQDLIKDGLQAIDDKFLEWYVKNPSCEFVEVDRDEREIGNHLGGVVIEYGDYKIIIPKEPKPIHQQIIDIVGGEDRFKEIAGIKPKQETLEELGRFAERKYLERLNNYENCDFSNGVIEGAKWQAERMFSDEEVIDLLAKFRRETDFIPFKDILEWFKQFKKK
jgi:hypothetical protein